MTEPTDVKSSAIPKGLWVNPLYFFLSFSLRSLTSSAYSGYKAFQRSGQTLWLNWASGFLIKPIASPFVY